MKSSLSYTIVQWMKSLKVPVSKSFINNRLQQHPDFPSVLSITDTLDDLGIENMALKIEKENLPELPIPFLAHVNTNGGDYELITNRSVFANTGNEFYKRWSGVVIAAETSDHLSSAENKGAFQKENKKKLLQLAFITTLLLISVLSVYISGNWLLVIMIASSISGVGITVLILLQELGIENKLADALCIGGRGTDCTTVINSHGDRLLWGFKWSDIGIIYFILQMSILVFAGFGNRGVELLIMYKWLSVTAIPFIVFSIHYQWKVAKKWCTLCLSVVSILLIQMAILIVFMTNWVIRISWQQGIVAIFLLFGITSGWLLLKGVLIENKRTEKRLFEALRFKNNTDVFWSFLKQQRSIKVNPFEYELEIATAGSSLQILTACNPYCVPCAKAHNALHEIADKYKGKISIVVRFGIDSGKEEDKKTKTVKHILSILNTDSQLRAEKNRMVLHDWFSTMDINKFQEKYPLKHGVDVQAQLNEHDKWFTEAQIEATPTLFINGYQLPRAYSVNDLKDLIRGLLNKQE
jgi:uncharacterized membrane protein/thiol-disulfide isomerase/thioredoxin